MTGASPEYRAARIDALKHAIGTHIVVTDGAMGTMIQNLKLAESDFRGAKFAEFPSDLKGNNDILNLTQPQHIAQIHKSFLAAGAQIICTNTFNANSIAQSDYNMQSEVAEINHAGARLARNIADEWNAQHRDKICFVAGAMGPTNRTASISPDVTDPAYRNVTFDALVQAYSEAASALLSGGADFLLLETIFDTLNAKAAIFAVLELREKNPYPIELIISGTITDLSGRTLSGQTIEAFWNSVRHAAPLAVGLNCALGAKQLRPYLVDLSRIADIPVIAYPNAGLPNEMGEYDETPQATAEHLGEWARSGLINIVGGCCGTTPQHIRAISDSLAECPPRPIPEIERRMRLSGLEPFEMA